MSQSLQALAYAALLVCVLASIMLAPTYDDTHHEEDVAWCEEWIACGLPCD